MGLTKKDLEEIRKIIQEESKNLLNDEYLTAIMEKVICKLGDKYEKMMANQGKRIDELSAEVRELRLENNKLSEASDRLEQYSRKLNVRIFGVKMNNSENVNKTVLDIFQKRMKVDVQERDIKKCYRITTKKVNNMNKNEERPAAILVRFVSDERRWQVLKKRRQLKGSGISIQEDLTKYKLNLLHRALENFEKKCVWCRNGSIFVKCDDTVHQIENEEQLQNIAPGSAATTAD